MTDADNTYLLVVSRENAKPKLEHGVQPHGEGPPCGPHMQDSGAGLTVAESETEYVDRVAVLSSSQVRCAATVPVAA